MSVMSKEEIVQRLDSLAVEYDKAVREALTKLTKVDNIKKDIVSLVEKLKEMEQDV